MGACASAEEEVVPPIRGVAGLYDDPRLQEHFGEGELQALVRIVEAWCQEQLAPFEARRQFLKEVFRGKSDKELSMESASAAAGQALAGQAGQSGARSGADVGKEVASSLSSTFSSKVNQATANSNWAPSTRVRGAGHKAASALGVLGMVAGSIVGGVGIAMLGGTQEGIRSRRIFIFVDRVFLRATRAQAWELGAQVLDIEGVTPEATVVEAKLQEKLGEVLGGPGAAGHEAAASSNSREPVQKKGGAAEPQTPQGTWLRLVQLFLSTELVLRLPAPHCRVPLPKEPLTTSLRMDEEYINNRIQELAAAVDQLSSSKAGGMGTARISVKCPAEHLAQSLDEVCPICLEELEVSVLVRRLPCGHILHKDCCDRWINTSATCPTCRCDLRA